MNGQKVAYLLCLRLFIWSLSVRKWLLSHWLWFCYCCCCCSGFSFLLKLGTISTSIHSADSTNISNCISCSQELFEKFQPTTINTRSPKSFYHISNTYYTQIEQHQTKLHITRQDVAKYRAWACFPPFSSSSFHPYVIFCWTKWIRAWDGKLFSSWNCWAQRWWCTQNFVTTHKTYNIFSTRSCLTKKIYI